MDCDNVTYPERLLIHECGIRRITATGETDAWGKEITVPLYDTYRCRFGNTSGGLFAENKHSADIVYCIVPHDTPVKATDVLLSFEVGYFGAYIVNEIKIATLADRVSHLVLQLKIADREA